jgi:hypothetical protein
VEYVVIGVVGLVVLAVVVVAGRFSGTGTGDRSGRGVGGTGHDHTRGDGFPGGGD